MKINFSPEIKNAAVGLVVLLIEADVTNAVTSDALWAEIQEACAAIAAQYPMEAIRHRAAIAATRATYKALGKDPNRYRPSAEALCRRAVKSSDLYRTLSIIDLINLVSIQTGVSIGGFDGDKIEGDTLTLSVGIENEAYEAIGRGQLNIGGLPVFRDAHGPIGTPTSDVDRTKLSPDTKRVVMTVNLYAMPEGHSIESIDSLLRRLLTDYADARNIVSTVYENN